MNYHEEHARGTGRTTGLMISAIGAAIIARGEPVPFVDHSKMTQSKAIVFRRIINNICTTLGLHVEVSSKGNKVFLKSTHKQQQKEN